MKSPRQLRLAVVGAGALGSHLCARLAALALPPGSVLLIDPDVLEERNLPVSSTWTAIARQHGAAVLGKNKAALLADFCTSSQPRSAQVLTRWIACPVAFASIGWQELQAVDLLVTVTDNMPSRLEAAYASQSLGLPMLDGGVHGDTAATGRAAFYPGSPHTACYGCNLTTATRAAALTTALGAETGCATHSLPAAMNASPETTAALDATAEALMAIIQSFVTNGVPANAYTVNTDGNEPPYSDSALTTRAEHCAPPAWNRHHLSRGQDCPWHTPLLLRPIEHDLSLRDQLVRDELFLLPDRALGPEDPDSGLTPRQLNLPPRHVLPVRTRIQRS